MSKARLFIHTEAHQRRVQARRRALFRVWAIWATPFVLIAAYAGLNWAEHL